MAYTMKTTTMVRMATANRYKINHKLPCKTCIIHNTLKTIGTFLSSASYSYRYILFAGNLHFLYMLQRAKKSLLFGIFSLSLSGCYVAKVKLFSHFDVVYRASMYVIWFIIKSINFYTFHFTKYGHFVVRDAAAAAHNFFSSPSVVSLALFVFKWLRPRKLKFNHRETIHGRRMHIKINHKILLTVCAFERGPPNKFHLIIKFVLFYSFSLLLCAVRT